MKIFIAADHRGIDLREKLIVYLQEQGIDVERSKIPNQSQELDDYPDFAFDIGKKVLENEGSLGILICSDGLGMSIAANKVKGIRCGRVLNTDEVFKAKNHDGANVIALGSEVSSLDEIKAMVDMFIYTKPVAEERRLRRLKKIIDYENGTYNEL